MASSLKGKKPVKRQEEVAVVYRSTRLCSSNYVSVAQWCWLCNCQSNFAVTVWLQFWHLVIQEIWA